MSMQILSRSSLAEERFDLDWQVSASRQNWPASLHQARPLPELKDHHAAYAMIAFLGCFIAAALVCQIYSGIHPTKDNSPLDYFTGGALWMASAVSLIMATAYLRAPLKMLFWLGGCIGLALLAIDEFMGVHEATLSVVGDDDHSKVFLWAGMPLGLYLILRMEQASRAVMIAFATGFLFHSIYLTVDIGDGDYFTLPFALNTLQWTEDICELLFVSSYLFGFLVMLHAKIQPGGKPR